MSVRSLLVMLAHLPRHGRRMAALIPPLAHLGFDSEARRWREELMPEWRAAVEAARTRVERLPLDELPVVIDELIRHAARQAASIVGVSGYAAKAELKLAKFWKQHLGAVDGGWLDLVAGAAVEPAHHDVEGLDWVLPTLGERGPLPPRPSSEAGTRVRERRDRTEALARAALSESRRRRFDALVVEARRGHAARQEQTGLFTLAWPVLRRAVLRMGTELASGGALDGAEDVFFIERAELEALLEGSPVKPPVRERRATWVRQSRLVPPLMVGELTGTFKKIFAEVDALLHHQEHDEPDALRGMPGSPGRVSGTARVVRSLDELHRLGPGEVLVAPVTTPAWTTGFARAAAVVTDTGSVASHASIVAREHGIPAVVGTGLATARIMDGQWITVDGGRGVVRLGS